MVINRDRKVATALLGAQIEHLVECADLSKGEISINSQSATDLYANVVEALAFDPGVDARDINVAVSDDLVTLTGFVKSYAQKLAAQRAVEGVQGVCAIAEQLAIELPLFHRRGDADIERSAREALAWNEKIFADSVVVNVERGWVTLTGTVASDQQREAARLAVASLAGICGLSNDIALLPIAVDWSVQ